DKERHCILQVALKALHCSSNKPNQSNHQKHRREILYKYHPSILAAGFNSLRCYSHSSSKHPATHTGFALGKTTANTNYQTATLPNSFANMPQITPHAPASCVTRLLDYLRTIAGLRLNFKSPKEDNIALTKMTTACAHDNQYLDGAWNYILEICQEEMEERIADGEAGRTEFWTTISNKLANSRQFPVSEQLPPSKNMDILVEILQVTVTYMVVARMSWLSRVGRARYIESLRAPKHVVLCNLDILLLLSLRKHRFWSMWYILGQSDGLVVLYDQKIDAHVRKLKEKKKSLGYSLRRPEMPEDQFRMKWTMSEEDLLELSRKVKADVPFDDLEPAMREYLGRK
ncbi:hypothetical protein EDB81DRAFT_935143, partial [Dactylonectria macrodidyma]